MRQHFFFLLFSPLFSSCKSVKSGGICFFSPPFIHFFSILPVSLRWNWLLFFPVLLVSPFLRDKKRWYERLHMGVKRSGLWATVITSSWDLRQKVLGDIRPRIAEEFRHYDMRPNLASLLRNTLIQKDLYGLIGLNQSDIHLGVERGILPYGITLSHLCRNSNKWILWIFQVILNLLSLCHHFDNNLVTPL